MAVSKLLSHTHERPTSLRYHWNGIIDILPFNGRLRNALFMNRPGLRLLTWSLTWGAGQVNSRLCRNSGNSEETFGFLFAVGPAADTERQSYFFFCKTERLNRSGGTIAALVFRPKAGGKSY